LSGGEYVTVHRKIGDRNVALRLKPRVLRKPDAHVTTGRNKALALALNAALDNHVATCLNPRRLHILHYNNVAVGLDTEALNHIAGDEHIAPEIDVAGRVVDITVYHKRVHNFDN